MLDGDMDREIPGTGGVSALNSSCCCRSCTRSLLIDGPEWTMISTSTEVPLDIVGSGNEDAFLLLGASGDGDATSGLSSGRII